MQALSHIAKSQHSEARDRISRDTDILCFEMEAAGLSSDTPCSVIRGICDYADSHSNVLWQGAAYAKELLLVIRPEPLKTSSPLPELKVMISSSE